MVLHFCEDKLEVELYVVNFGVSGTIEASVFCSARFALVGDASNMFREQGLLL